MAIATDVERKLLARAGGFCSNPGCRQDLFPEVPGGLVATIKELAHIIPQSPHGPRGQDADLPLSERDQYENIVLLCPNCHTLVDKQKLTEYYDEELLREWKRQQEERIRNAMDAPELESRDELVERVHNLLRENREWWKRYGPESDEAEERPFSEAFHKWLSATRRYLIPNNWTVIQLVQRNSGYLTPKELAVVEEFKVHAQVFADRHLVGELDPSAPRFPDAMNEIFGR